MMSNACSQQRFKIKTAVEEGVTTAVVCVTIRRVLCWKHFSFVPVKYQQFLCQMLNCIFDYFPTFYFNIINNEN
jgi:hypothetical protein